MKILVLAGGLSPERDVSLSSGAMIASALSRRGHSVAFCDLYCGIDRNKFSSDTYSSGSDDCGTDRGQNFTDDEIDSLFEKGRTYSFAVPQNEPDLKSIRGKYDEINGHSLIGRGILHACRRADVVFNALHGGIGENGRLQGILDCIPAAYTGSSCEGSMLAMDKDLTKQILVHHGISTAPWLYFKNESCGGTECIKNAIVKEIGYPCVVKPAGCGSSCGVSIIYSETQLRNALCSALNYEDSFIVEKMIKGREFSVGILDGKPLPVIEIIPKTGWYDYVNKYQNGLTDEITPADLSGAQTEEVQNAAMAVHNALRLGGYSRIDFILDEKTCHFVCLEANNLPGMTPTSLLPKEAAAAGMEYDTLCETIAENALKNFNKMRSKV